MTATDGPAGSAAGSSAGRSGHLGHPHPLVGVWVVTAPDAPFPHHVFTFHADGTFLQSNPPSGNRTSSDSAGMGVWAADPWGGGRTVRGRFAETTADPGTGVPFGLRFVDVTLVLADRGDLFTGTARTGALGGGEPGPGSPVTTLQGRRLTLGVDGGRWGHFQ